MLDIQLHFLYIQLNQKQILVISIPYGYSFQIEMTCKAYRKGFIIREIPIMFNESDARVSKMNPGIVWEAIWMLFRIRFRIWPWMEAITPAAEGYGLWPWMNVPSFGRDVVPHGPCSGTLPKAVLCPWGSTSSSKKQRKEVSELPTHNLYRHMMRPREDAEAIILKGGDIRPGEWK